MTKGNARQRTEQLPHAALIEGEYRVDDQAAHLAQQLGIEAQSASQLDSILDSMGDGVVVADGEGELRFANRRAKELLGDPVKGRNLSSWPLLVPNAMGLAEPITPARDPLARAIAGAEFPSAELLLRRAEQPDVLLLVVANPLRGWRPVESGGVALLRDITAERQLEEELHRAQKLDAIGQLAGGIAHDFNNCLSVIQSYMSLIQGSLEPGSPVYADAERVTTATSSAAKLVRQLLIFGRGRSDEQPFGSLNQVAAAIETLLRRLIGPHIELVTHLAPDLEPVSVHETHLEQVVMNLALNARDAMPDGGRLTILTEACTLASAEGKVGPAARIVVADTGAGMSEAVKRRVFEPFFTTKEVGRGTGLGLSTVYGIVQRGGGTIDVTSREGAGTTFTIVLPACQRDSVRPESVSVVPKERQRRVILIVDDDPLCLDATQRLLQKHGHVVLTASDALEALEICSRQDPPVELVLTDVAMHEVHGSPLMERLKALNDSIRILFMSGYVDTRGAVDEFLRNGELLLEKPFTPEQLARKVDLALET